MLKENSYTKDDGDPFSSEGNLGVNEMLSRPDLIVVIFGSVFVLLGVAIRLTRVSFGSSIQSFMTLVDEPIYKLHEKGLRVNNGFISSFKTFWGRLPRRFWNFYIEAFLIPCYRKEWGQYKSWSYRSRNRPPKSPHIRKLMRTQKRTRGRTAMKDGMPTNIIPHNHAHCQRIRINVCGMIYETQLRTLERFPDTLLGNPIKRTQYYDPVKQEYYFDRNRYAFEAILYFYQSGGRFRRPENVNADVLLEDAQFYQLNQAVLDQFRNDEGLSNLTSKQEIVPQNLLRRKIWLLFDTPESSLQAAYIAVLSVSACFLSITVFCIETLDSMGLKMEHVVENVQTGRIGVVKPNLLNIHDPFFLLETACNLWFIIEFVTRFMCCPFYLKFLRSPLNLVDLIAIAPFFISVVFPTASKLLRNDKGGADVATTAADSLNRLRILRLVRVFRIFQLSRHYRGLKILGKTLKASLNELILLIFFIILGVILFSSTMYFAELDHPNTQYDSIPGGFWWALITITTVGFGDVVPKSFLGKIVGALCAVAGVLTIALPVPVIVSNFNFFYHQAIDEGDLKWININHVSHCPYRPGGNSTHVQKIYGKKSKNVDNERKYSSDEEFHHLKHTERKKSSKWFS